MKNLTPELSEIIGLLCAEGSHVISYNSYWSKDRGRDRYFKNDKSERIEFSNNGYKLLKHYQSLLKKAFDYSAKITKHRKVNICTMRIIRFLIEKTEFGHMKWKVPDFIKKGSDNHKISFLRGYFDGDGTSSNRARFFSTNQNGLREVSELLKDLKIKHTLQKPVIKKNRKPFYCIQISEKEKEIFLNLIKPISKIPDNMRG